MRVFLIMSVDGYYPDSLAVDAAYAERSMAEAVRKQLVVNALAKYEGKEKPDTEEFLDESYTLLELEVL